MTDVPIRDAASIILVRDPQDNPRILMGQRGRTAAFMPDKFVFPGGAVDDCDADMPVTMSADCEARLRVQSGCAPTTLAATAIRELWEETGQCMGEPGNWPAPPQIWEGFAAKGLLPNATTLRFFFRAITPPGRPRRFDARFFLADADALRTDLDIFEPAEAELYHLQWVSISKSRELNLPFITRVVLAELERHLPRTDAPDKVPFVRNDDISRDVVWL